MRCRLCARSTPPLGAMSRGQPSLKMSCTHSLKRLSEVPLPDTQRLVCKLTGQTTLFQQGLAPSLKGLQGA